MEGKEEEQRRDRIGCQREEERDRMERRGIVPDRGEGHSGFCVYLYSIIHSTTSLRMHALLYAHNIIYM